MCDPWSNSSLYFLYWELKSGDNESLTQSHPGISTWAHTRIPRLPFVYSGAWLRSLSVCRRWGALLGGTWVCLSCVRKPHCPLLPGHGQGGHWVSEVSASSHLGWVTGSHNGQWGRGKEGGLNFPWPFPSLISSLTVFLWQFRLLSVMAHVLTLCWLLLFPAPSVSWSPFTHMVTLLFLHRLFYCLLES